ncbi:MAG: hypothetical protein EA424_04145, partial [Planctomycetaceae bacterium]
EVKLVVDPVADTREFGRAIAMDGDTLVVGAKLKKQVGDDQDDDDDEDDSDDEDERDDQDFGVVYVYHWSGSSWTERAKLWPSDLRQGGGGDFGYSVAVHGDTILVGAPGDNSRGTNTGAVYVFAQNDGAWAPQAKLVANDRSADSRFGESVAVSGTVALVGRPGTTQFSDGNEAAYFFRQNGSVWDQEFVIRGEGDFGRSVALVGNTAVVGAPEANGSGAVYVYNHDTIWKAAQQVLTPADPQPSERFGQKIAYSGSLIVVGAPNWTNPARNDGLEHGRAFVFHGSGDSWVREARLTADGGLPEAEATLEGKAGDHFGAAVATDGTYVVIGAPDVDISPALNAGAAYVFYRLPDQGSGNGASWTRSSGKSGPGKLEAKHPAAADEPNGAPLPDNFGSAVAIAGGRIVVGIPGFNEIETRLNEDDEPKNFIIRADVGSIRTFTVGSLSDVTADKNNLRAEILAGGPSANNADYAARTVYEPHSRTLFVAAPAEQKVYAYINEGLYWRPTVTLQPSGDRGLVTSTRG